jgi:hypothetical protein
MLASSTTRVLSEDLERESQKVRSMYEQGTMYWEDGKYAGIEQRLEEPNTPTK